MGEGPDVLLLHGLGATKTSFFDTAAALSRRYRVHALDLPGLRRLDASPRWPVRRRRSSPAPSLGVMDALGIERAHLVGNSMGGRVALEVGPASARTASAASRCCAPRWRSCAAS